MSTLIYWGVVAAGAVTLLIDAKSKFDLSLNTTPFSEYPILRETQISELCTPAERHLSFAFYSLLYLITYAAILTSTELFALMSKASSAGLTIGPIDTIAGHFEDPTGLLDKDYGKPIFVSAAIIAALKVRTFEPVERTMRRLAHRLAGVPRGVYVVIQGLQRATAPGQMKGDLKGSLVLLFDDKVSGDFVKRHGKIEANKIRSALQTVDQLAPPLTGQERITHFPAAQLDSMSKLSNALETEIEDLHKLLTTEPMTDEAHKKIKEAAIMAANNTVALFAVHFLRNNRAVINVSESVVVKEVEKKIRVPYAIEANSVTMAFFATFVLSAGLTFWQLQDWASARTDQYTSELRLAVYKTFKPPASPTTEFIDTAQRCATAVVSEEPAKRPPTACEKAWIKALASRHNADRHQSFRNAPVITLPVIVAVLLAAIAAITGRGLQIENSAWPGWPFRQPPFLRLMLMSIIPALLAVFGVAATETLIQWFTFGFKLQANDIVRMFQVKGIYFALHAVIGFAVSIAVLTLSDLHDAREIPAPASPDKPDENAPADQTEVRRGLHWYETVLLGAAFGAVTLFFYFVLVTISYGPTFYNYTVPGATFSYIQRELIIYGSVPMIFLIFYAGFLEFTEAGARRRIAGKKE